MPLQPRRLFDSFVFVSICLMATLQGCSTIKSDIPDPKAKENQIRAEKFKESQRVFELRNPIIVSNISELELVVRIATKAEIPEDFYKMWAVFPAEGAGSLALGLVAPPLYASALVVGGILLIPLGTYGYLHDKKIWESINTALTNFEFTRAVDKAIQRRSKVFFNKESPPDVKIEIIILDFGIIESSAMNRGCFVISADIIVSRDNLEVKREKLRIAEYNGSKDAPPPQCASLEHFAKAKARLVTDTLTEYSEVLAVTAIESILRESKK